MDCWKAPNLYRFIGASLQSNFCVIFICLPSSLPRATHQASCKRLQCWFYGHDQEYLDSHCVPWCDLNSILAPPTPPSPQGFPIILAKFRNHCLKQCFSRSFSHQGLGLTPGECRLRVSPSLLSIAYKAWSGPLTPLHFALTVWGWHRVFPD